MNLITPSNPINTINIYDFYKIIDKIKYSKIKVANKLKKICTEQVVQVAVNKIVNYKVVSESINNKTVCTFRLIIQDYTVCLYFDINNKDGIGIYLSCDIISSKIGRVVPSSFTINFRKNIAKENHTSNANQYLMIAHLKTINYLIYILYCYYAEYLACLDISEKPDLVLMSMIFYKIKNHIYKK